MWGYGETITAAVLGSFRRLRVLRSRVTNRSARCRTRKLLTGYRLAKPCGPAVRYAKPA
jgi:hypothetical protein